MIDDIIVPDVQIVGNFPVLTRVRTGLLSLDYALSSKANLGMPLRVITELYGYTNVGKSTLAYYLAGAVSKAMGGSISVADLEMNDTSYIPQAIASSGYKGKVHMMDIMGEKGKPLTHAQTLMLAAKRLLREDTSAIIWDSVGATQAEVQMDVLFDPKGEFGQAHMGVKAKLVGEIANALRTALITKQTPSTAILINHVHQVIGGRGHTTPGGERKGFLAGARIMLRPAETIRATDESDSEALGYLVQGQIEKLRFGGDKKGTKFYFYIVPGYGVHVGATAMFDSFMFGEAERGARIKMDGKNMGLLKKDFLVYAVEGRQRKFYPFIERMQEVAERIERGETLETESSDNEE